MNKSFQNNESKALFLSITQTLMICILKCSILKNLKNLYSRMLCAKFGLNQQDISLEKVRIVKSLQTARQTIGKF